MYVFITLIIVLLKEKACHFYMFMLFFGLEKKALLLVFVLLLARTACFETLNREKAGCTPPLLILSRLALRS